MSRFIDSETEQDKLEMTDLIHGDCHYFALALAELFRYKLILWLEYDEDIERMAIVHAFCIRGKGSDKRFIDARGITLKLDDIKQGFDYGEDTLTAPLSTAQFKMLLNKLAIPYNSQSSINKCINFIKSNIELYK